MNAAAVRPIADRVGPDHPPAPVASSIIPGQRRLDTSTIRSPFSGEVVIGCCRPPSLPPPAPPTVRRLRKEVR